MLTIHITLDELSEMKNVTQKLDLKITPIEHIAMHAAITWYAIGLRAKLDVGKETDARNLLFNIPITTMFV